jgi:hypothetical protein
MPVVKHVLDCGHVAYFPTDHNVKEVAAAVLTAVEKELHSMRAWSEEMGVSQLRVTVELIEE